MGSIEELDRGVDFVGDGFDEVCGFGPLGAGGWASDDEAVGTDGDEELVDIVGGDMVAALDPCPCTGGVGKGEGASGGDADIDLGGVTGGAGEVDDVVFDGIGEVDVVDRVLDVDDLVGVDDGLERFEHGVAGAEFEEFLFGLFVGVAEGDAHEEAVELVFGEGVGAEEIVGVLGGDDHEGLGEFVALAVHGDHALAHGFEECGLGSWAGAVDFVCEDDAGKEGAALEAHLAGVSGEDGVAEEIGGHHVGGELNAGEGGVDGFGEGGGEERFADARDIFKERVASCEEAAEELVDGIGGAEVDGLYLVAE